MSSMGADLGVTVDANVQPYEKSLQRAEASTYRYATSLKRLEADMMALEKSIDDRANEALERQHRAMEKTGRTAFVFGAALAAALALSANEAVQWESQWAGVTKTTSGTAEEMGQLEDQLRALTSVLPATHEEIAATAEAAGQLGVAREDLADFTAIAIKLGTSTNLSADQAATSIAQLMNSMKSVPDVVDEIGNTLVALGNNGASTEEQILDMAQRLAGVGNLIGASEADVLGLAAAMANLGIQSELGGGAAQRVLLNIYSSVKTGGDAVQGFADLAGMSADEFSRAFTEDPLTAFNQLLQGMGRLRDGGGDLIGTLADLGIKGTQNLQVILRLAGAGDELTTSLDGSRKAWDDNNALLIEAEKRYGTTASQVAIARNELRDSAIDIGNMLLPAIRDIVGTGADLLRFWQDLPGPVRDVAVVVGLATTAIALFGGAALVAIPRIAAFNSVVEGLGPGALKTAGTRLSSMASILAGPWGLAIAGGITALTIFGAKHGEAAREVDALKATLDEQTGAITDNSREWAAKKLFDEGALDDAKTLGLNLQTVTDAVLGNSEAMKTVNAALGDYDRVLTANNAGTGQFTDEQIKAAQAGKGLHDTLGDVLGIVTEGKRQFELTAEAVGATGDATSTAGEAQTGTTQAWKSGTDAASGLTDAVKTLGEELADQSEAYLSQRDANRAVRESLRGIRDAVKDYTKEHGGLGDAFKQGSKSGDEFAGMLDGLAKDYQNQIEATENLTGSQKATMQTYRDSRRALREQAEALGMTKKEAQEYVDTVLSVPAIAKTHFDTDNLDPALSKVSQLAARLAELNGDLIAAGETGDLDVRRGGQRAAQQGRRGVPAGLSTESRRAGRRDVMADYGRALAAGGTRPQGRAATGDAAFSIDYDELGKQIAKHARPVYGDVTVIDGYGGFKKQLEADTQRAGLGGPRSGG